MISLFDQFMTQVEKNCKDKEIVETIRKRMRSDDCFDEVKDIDYGWEDNPGAFAENYDDKVSMFRRLKEEQHWGHLRDATSMDMELEERIIALEVFYEDRNPFPKTERVSEENTQGMYGRTRLHNAVLEEDLDAISELIKGGIDYTLKDNNGYTPYLLGVLEGKIKAIKRLKKHGIRE